VALTASSMPMGRVGPWLASSRAYEILLPVGMAGPAWGASSMCGSRCPWAWPGLAGPVRAHLGILPPMGMDG
jgi:hypothetical protein